MLLTLRSINHIVIVNTLNRAVGRNNNNIQTVNLIKFERFGVRCPRHTRKLVIQTEKILERR